MKARLGESRTRLRPGRGNREPFPRRRRPRRISANCSFSTTGLSSSRFSVWDCPSSRTFLRLPNRVFRLMTRCSRSGSMGGFVTCEKILPEEMAEGTPLGPIALPAARRPPWTLRPPSSPRPWDGVLSPAPRSSTGPRSGSAGVREAQGAGDSTALRTRGVRSKIREVHSRNGREDARASLMS